MRVRSEHGGVDQPLASRQLYRRRGPRSATPVPYHGHTGGARARRAPQAHWPSTARARARRAGYARASWSGGPRPAGRFAASQRHQRAGNATRLLTRLLTAGPLVVTFCGKGVRGPLRRTSAEFLCAMRYARAFFALAINLHEASLTGVGKDNVYNAMRKPNKGCARFFRAGAVPRRLRAKRGPCVRPREASRRLSYPFPFASLPPRGVPTRLHGGGGKRIADAVT